MPQTIKISDTLHDLPLIDYREVKELQGELKELSQDNYNRLLKSLKQFGFIVPLFIWNNNGEYYFIDGHQRNKVLKQENIKPYKLPYIEIEAETIVEAKQKLLVISSQYGKVTREGFDDFVVDVKADFITDFVNFDIITPYIQNIEENNLSTEQLNLEEKFDPVGIAKDIQRVVFIFDNKAAAEIWLKEIPNIMIKKFNNIWQVNLSTLYT